MISVVSLSVKDFNKTCRICLDKENDLKPLSSPEISHMISYCCFLEVNENENFPKNVCLKCKDLLEQFYKFKQLCSDSELVLKQIIADSFTENIINDKSRNDLSNNNLLYSDHSNEEFNSSYKNVDNISFTVSNKYTCDLCNRQFQNDPELQEHIENDHLKSDNGFNEDLVTFLEADPPPPLPYACKKCSQSFSKEKDFKLHESIHSEGTQCIECFKVFTTRRLLKKHIKIHMEYKPHICSKCGKGFAESYSLTKHMKSKHMGIPRAKKHICEECGQGFSEPFYLNLHKRKHTGERPLNCDECGKTFADPRSFRTHKMIHTGEKPHKCPNCSKCFSQKVNLTKHIRVHTGEKPYSCQECGKSFTQSSSLEKHFRTHTGEKPYQCNMCEKRFGQKTTLKGHLERHLGLKSYVCAVCGLSFKNAFLLNVHDRKHLGEKKNVCNVCGKDFAAPSNLIAHSRIHTGERPYKCEVCLKAFVNNGSLKRHYKIHHLAKSS